MTDNHPTPPPELVEEWLTEWMSNVLPGTAPQYIATQAARWASDQELEACCEWLVMAGWFRYEHAALCQLRAARRPKPPSLSKPALAVLDDASDRLDAAHENTIRRALERLQELEGND